MAFTIPAKMLIAHALLVEAEAARQRGDDAAPCLLWRVRAAYQRLGAMGFVARADVGLVLGGERGIPYSALLTHCRRHHYGFEVQRLEGIRSGFYPIHFV